MKTRFHLKLEETIAHGHLSYQSCIYLQNLSIPQKRHNKRQIKKYMSTIFKLKNQFIFHRSLLIIIIDITNKH